MNKYLISVLSVTALINLTACGPVLFAGAAGTAAAVASKDKTLGETVDDSKLVTKINKRFLDQKGGGEYFGNINVSANQGRVLLAGKVGNPHYRVQATKIAWEFPETKEVINEIKVDSDNKYKTKDYANDAWITTQVKTRLLTNKNVKSVNYNIDTVDGEVYILGLAHSDDELKIVSNIAASTKGVKKVHNHAKILGN